MIPEREIWQAANLMIKRHGAEAAVHAAMRADELLAEGDIEGAATWRAVIRAIDQLQADKPTVGGTEPHSTGASPVIFAIASTIFSAYSLGSGPSDALSGKIPTGPHSATASQIRNRGCQASA